MFDWTKVEMRRVVCVEFFIFGGSLLGRIQGDREPVVIFGIQIQHSECNISPIVTESLADLVVNFHVVFIPLIKRGKEELTTSSFNCSANSELMKEF